MGIRFLMMVVFSLFLTGCATASKTSPVSQLQVQMTEMQQRMEDQEKEVVDLKYEVKELSSKSVDESVNLPAAPVAVKAETVKSLEPRNLDIIKVDISGRELQKALKSAGVYEGKVDGKVGPKTKAAVAEFQKNHGLKADGVVGQKTWNELKAYRNSSEENARKSAKE